MVIKLEKRISFSFICSFTRVFTFNFSVFILVDVVKKGITKNWAKDAKNWTKGRRILKTGKLDIVEKRKREEKR